MVPSSILLFRTHWLKYIAIVLFLSSVHFLSFSLTTRFHSISSSSSALYISPFRPPVPHTHTILAFYFLFAFLFFRSLQHSLSSTLSPQPCSTPLHSVCSPNPPFLQYSLSLAPKSTFPLHYNPHTNTCSPLQAVYWIFSGPAANFRFACTLALTSDTSMSCDLFYRL